MKLHQEHKNDLTQFYQVSLPSSFEPYAFKTAQVKPVNAIAQMRLSYAATAGTTRSLVKAIQPLFDPAEEIFNLTPEDFYYVLMFMYSNSFLARPFATRQICKNREHLSNVEKNLLAPQTLVNDLKIEPDAIEVVVKNLKQSHIAATFKPTGKITQNVLRYPTIEDTCWAEEAAEKIAEYATALESGTEDDVEIDPFLIPFATNEFLMSFEDFIDITLPLKTPDNYVGDPFEWRLSQLEVMTPEELDSLRSWSEAISGRNDTGSSYGAFLKTRYVCKECGAEQGASLHVLPRNFF